MIIDAHQHVWDLARASYPWLTAELAPIDRTITFDELVPALTRTGVDGTVLVQSADNADDTALMFDVAARNPEVLGIVGYVPLDRPEDVESSLAALRANPLFVGVRNLIHDIPDPDWLLRDEVDRSLGLLEAARIPFDVVAVLPRHIEILPLIAERHPDLRMIVDHLAKPPIGLQNSEPWDSLMSAAAENPNLFAKVSGLYSAVGPSGSWTTELVRPFVDRALELFGPDRVMYGGDWPISLLSGGYDRVWAALNEIFSTWSARDRSAVLGGTAERCYTLDPSRIAALPTRAGPGAAS